MYDDWTFSSYNYWNDYYYSTNRTQLYKTAEYQIGKDKIIEIILETRPEKRVDKNTNVTQTIFTIPITYTNSVYNTIKYQRAYDTN